MVEYLCNLARLSGPGFISNVCNVVEVIVKTSVSLTRIQAPDFPVTPADGWALVRLLACGCVPRPRPLPLPRPRALLRCWTGGKAIIIGAILYACPRGIM